MKISNLPPNASVVTTDVSKYDQVIMRSFRLCGTDFSLEEAVAIEGFYGYVVPEKDGTDFEVVPTATGNIGKKGRPMPIVAVVFMKPLEIKVCPSSKISNGTGSSGTPATGAKKEGGESSSGGSTQKKLQSSKGEKQSKKTSTKTAISK
jgi:hypothetical protein